MAMAPTITSSQAREHILAGESKAIRVDASIDLSGTDLKAITCAVACNDLDLSGTAIQTLSPKVKVRSRLNLDNCKQLERLPAGLSCGSLSVRGCTFLERLPERLTTWFLNASDCPRLSQWPQEASIQNGNVQLRNGIEVRSLPNWLGPLGQLDLSGCVNLHEVPEGLRISGWIDIGGSSILSLPNSLQTAPLRWRSVPVTHQIAFEPEKITSKQVLAEKNAELRRVMIERMGYLKFSEQVGAKELDQDIDAGGKRQLLKIEIDLYHNAKTFIGKRVADYDPNKKVAPGGKTVYRFRSDYDEANCIPHLTHFLESDAAAEAVGIVIGNWAGDDSDGDPSAIIQLLCDKRDRLSSLKAIYLGDIISEENEMSWIHQADVSPLLEAFPNLELLRTRGGNGLSISQPKHANLRGLICESGGLPAEVVRTIGRSQFPSLEHLELWLGTQEYGGDSTVEDLQPILSGERFPNLKYLGLRNCEFADDIAAVIVNSPLIKRIETLDLSLGVMTDEGGRALLSLPTDGILKHASVHYHYMTNEVTKLLSKLRIKLDLSKPSQMDDDEEWRFVAVGE